MALLKCNGSCTIKKENVQNAALPKLEKMVVVLVNSAFGCNKRGFLASNFCRIKQVII
ncbi:hypothetical protein COO91_08301 [Nostoc flagelliforme CCNUN1]|uniref:Uncharacterized protein n=1 Tax=Nostoc flagelliforme CCNUN1 TaxID=2038116 RepID=A0A2K8T3B4_9NOSO|nr:hypothetical protein COO91_08301 [Nostoc flagelliforme CCNUN1]